MPTQDEVMKELNQAIARALRELKAQAERGTSFGEEFLSLAKSLLASVLSTAVGVVEDALPGSAPLLYADMEARAKEEGLRFIQGIQSSQGTLTGSVSGLGPEDRGVAMNYLGQKMSLALFKGLHELPLPLRDQEMLLLSIEVLLANLLIHEFADPHQVLDSFSDHLHRGLKEIESRQKH